MAAFRQCYRIQRSGYCYAQGQSGRVTRDRSGVEMLTDCAARRIYGSDDHQRPLRARSPLEKPGLHRRGD